MTESTEAQIREQFPTMYMTIVSVVVALAFENLFALMKERDDLWSASSVLLWVQAAMVVTSGILFWFHSSLVSASIRQVFALRDAVNPFVVLFVLNVLVVTMDSHFSGFFLFWAAQGSTGVVVFGYWERLYEQQRNDPAVRGAFTAARLILAGIVLVSLGVSAGAWLEFVSPSAAAVIGFAIIVALLAWVQPAWRRGWQRAAGVSV